MPLSLSESHLGPALERLAKANWMFDQRYPADAAQRQPVHSVYGGAHRFKSDTAAKLGAIALDTFAKYLPDPAALACVTAMDARTAEAVHPRVRAKLEREPIEDFRIDFEDGYGCHTGEEEDAHALESALQTARGMRAASLPPFIGIRIKPLASALWPRAMRTLDIYLTHLLENTGAPPANFVVTLPKVTSPAQPAALHAMLDQIEARFNLPPRTLRIELMMEAPQLIVDEHGVCAIPALIDACNGRCRGLHFGPYDYTTAVGIPGSHQSLHHPSCDFARHMMQSAVAGTRIQLSDGPTKTLPIPPHRGQLTEQQQAANRDVVHHAMRVHYDDVRRSLHHGYYQGWDLHPAQFPMRYAAVYSFFLEGLDRAAGRLRNFLDSAAQATTLGAAFDDAASAQGLLNFFLQGHACGAFTPAELAQSGLTLDELRTRSFTAIMDGRRTQKP
ncbi:MAG: phosphoenolpyruvate kinase [Acidobacteria bacterium]|nr:phosphoenolpyruvate kinase [Acidobacteriota bacterium]